MKRLVLLFTWVYISLCATSQTIDMISLDRGYSVEVDELTISGFRLNLSFDTLSVLSVGDYLTVDLKSTTRYGSVGYPSLPVFRRPFAIPACENLKVIVKSYSVTEIDLSQYGGKKLMPQQPSLRKDEISRNIIINKDIYETDGFVSKSVAWCSRVGSMRGVEIGELNVLPMSYNPVTNILRMYNDIVVEVKFESAGKYLDAATSTPYFAQAYSTLLNRDVLEYTDLYHTPVKMLVVANEDFEEALRPWIEWKTQKGFYIDVEYVGMDVTAEDIARHVHARYAEGLAEGNAPVFVVLVGDVDRIPASAVGGESHEQTDLYYASVDGDYLPEMYLSRMSAETVDELSAIVEKTLVYEKYTMPDPSYLDNALLIAGQDRTWNPAIAQPTINYATQNYFNAEHGFENVYVYLDSYDGCYSHLHTGVGYAHYTAHGGEDCWAGPHFSNDSVNNLHNAGKYFLGIGNCCVSGKFGHTSPCFGEALIRSDKGGAFAYIGSCPNTYWYEDYYWAIGATNVFTETPTLSQTHTGALDLMFDDEKFNTVSSIMYGGNLAVTNSFNEGYTNTSPKYYWEAYNVLGDGSVMPYLSVPTANTVSHDNTFLNGNGYFTVEAAPGSYVALTDSLTILGTGLVGEGGIVNVRIDATATSDSVLLVVTRQQRIPHIEKIGVVLPSEAYLTVVDYSPAEARYDVSDPGFFTFEIKNIGLTATEVALPMRLRCADSRVEILDSLASCPVIQSGSTAEVASVFSFSVSNEVEDGCQLQFALIINDTVAHAEYVSNFSVRIQKPVLVIANSYIDGSVIPGSRFDINIETSNRGETACGNVHVTLQSLSELLIVEDAEVDYGEIASRGSADGRFGLSIASNAHFGDMLPLKVVMTTENLEFVDSIFIYVNICDMPIRDFPFVEDFQSQSIPDCWTQEKLGSSNAEWRVVDHDNEGQYANEDGNYYAYLFNSDRSPVSTRLISPKFDFSNVNRTVYLSFRHIQKDWWDDQDKLSIYYKVSDTSEWVHLRTYHQSLYSWTNERVALPNISENYRIGFFGEVRWGYGIALDDVKVELEQCIVPEISVSQDEQGQVTMTWTGNADNYILYKNGNQFAETTSNTINIDSYEACYVVEAHCGNNVERSQEYCAVAVSFDVEQCLLYPNPASEVVEIVCGKNSNVLFYNALGCLVKSLSLDEGHAVVQLDELPAGVYVVSIESADGKVVRKKLVKE